MSDQTVEVSIEGMTCPSCVYKITCEVEDLEGVNTAKVDLDSKRGTFQVDKSGPTGAEQILNKINQLGFKAQLVN